MKIEVSSKNIRVDELGFKHEFLVKYTPQSNGLVERKNRTLIDISRSILSEYDVSDAFWAEAINMACHASNSSLYCHKILKNTPYEILVGTKYNIHTLECLVANAIFSRKIQD